MAKFLADDHAAIAARLAELEAERRGDAPVIVGLDVARPGSDVSVGTLTRDGLALDVLTADELVELARSRPGPVVQVQPTPGIGFLASEIERHRLMLERQCGVPKALGLYDPSKSATSLKGGSGVQFYAAEWSTRPMTREEAVAKYPPAQPLSPSHDWSKGG